MFDDVRACQAVGDFLVRLLAREFPGVQAAFVCIAENGPPEETAEAAAVTETPAPETSPPVPPE